MTKQLLLEIGLEEVPAGFLKPAFADIERLAKKALDDNRIEHGNIRATGTPRRIVLVVDDVMERQADIVEEKIGPPVSSAFDTDGKPKPAATGFAAKLGITVDKLERIQTPKGEKIAAKISIPGRDVSEVLAELLPRIITSIPWRKSMRWGNSSFSFVRPIHWILAIFGGDVIPFELEGITSSNKTRGHRFMHPQAIEVNSYDDYAAKLKDAFVMVDHIERRKTIVDGVREKAAELKGEPASLDVLFDEVSFLVEWPVVISATFPERYLEVPAPALIAAMVGHQRYFPLKDKQGNLLNHFITVANTPARDLDVVARGNARVLNARLADAEFFYRNDLKKPLGNRLDELKGIIYLKEVGTYYEKTQRVIELASKVAGWVAPDNQEVKMQARRAAELAKTDLTTDMVKEFPSLQGVMGAIYARVQSEPATVANAIEEHYLPRSTGDIDAGILPKSLPGVCVAIADRADNLASCFSMALQPRGNQDPYALRRAVLGILAIIRSLSLRISLDGLFGEAVAGVKSEYLSHTELKDKIKNFFYERIHYQLDNEYGVTVANAVLSVLRQPSSVSGHKLLWYDDYLDILDKAKALSEFMKRHDFNDLAISFRRVGNILDEDSISQSVDMNLFSHDSERELYQAFLKLKDKVEEHSKKRDFAGALSLMAELRPQVDKFFDDVLVNDPKDEQRKINRHSLLYQIYLMFLEVADFSAISQ